MTGASICVSGNVSARTLLCGYLPRLAMGALLTLVLTATTASGQYCTPDQCDECDLCRCSQGCCHELPELWLVNTRCAPRCKNLDGGFDRLIYKRYDRECCRWVRESRESFLAQESSKPTLFYAHGNSLNHKNAMKGFWQVYCKMRCCPGPKRLVCWSWPAERVFKTEGLRVREMISKNLRIKYVYAEYQGYYMAKLVNQMSLSQRVMMSGHSYGGIITSAASHFIGAGCLRGLSLEGSAAVQRPNLRAAVISGAYDHDMLNPGNRYGQAFVAAEKIFVTRNIKDSTLKKWPKTSWRGRRAIGVIGVNANCLGEHRYKLCQQTMTSDVGKSHYLKPHLKSVRFVAALCCLSFPECNSCAPLMANSGSIEIAFAPELEIPADFVDQQLSEESVYDSEGFTFDASDAFDDNVDDYVDGIFANEEVELLESNEFDANVLQTDEFAMPTANGSQEFGISNLFAEKTSSSAHYRPTASNALANGTVTCDVDAFASETYLANVRSTPDDTISNQSVADQNQAADKPVVKKTRKLSSTRVWYRCGLCLAIVLTGQFYILFSKRVTPS